MKMLRKEYRPYPEVGEYYLVDLDSPRQVFKDGKELESWNPYGEDEDLVDNAIDKFEEGMNQLIEVDGKIYESCGEGIIEVRREVVRKTKEIIINDETSPEGLEIFRFYMSQSARAKHMPDFYKNLELGKRFTREELGTNAIYNKVFYTYPVRQYEYESLDIFFEKTDKEGIYKIKSYRLRIEEGSLLDCI